jgi:hypothetical protein
MLIIRILLGNGELIKNAGHGSVGGGTTTSHDRTAGTVLVPPADISKKADPPPSGIMNPRRLNLVKFS